MNYDVSRESLSFRNTEFEGCHEIPLDLDFSLPDYCPDIQRILKCRVSPNITSRNISGDRLNIEGTLSVRLIYLDSDGMKARCCENSAPFSASIDIKSTPENAVAFTSTRTEYLNCRAVSPRKVDIHGAVSVCAKIYGKAQQNLSCCISGKDVQQKIETKTLSNLVGIGQQQFSAEETFSTGENKPAPEMILRSDASIIADDYKIMPNKVVFKGKATVKLLYTDNAAAENLETLEYEIPISQIIDVPGVNEESRCVINAEILSHDEQIRRDSDDAAGMICTEMKIAAAVMAYNNKETAVVTDMYSTEYDAETETQNIKLTKLIDIIKGSFTEKSTVSLPEVQASKIIDIWHDGCSASAVKNADKFEIHGKINLCILAADADNIPFYVERALEFSHNEAAPETSDDITAEITIVPTLIGYSAPNGNSADIKITFDFYSGIYDSQSQSMVISASADESATAGKDRGASLIICYASKGESLWDIARRYYTSVSAIKQENDIPGDTAPASGMLLIPSK